MTQAEAIVYVIDDDALIRDSLQQLIKSAGLAVEVFSSAREFLNFELPDRPGCLLLDIRMPGMNGLELQQELKLKDILIPVIFITGHGTVPMSVRAMKAGAEDFLQKPFEDQELLELVHRAIDRSRHRRQQQNEFKDIEQRIKSLSVREHEVLLRVIDGMLNKQIAYELKISENTVKTHRSHIMRKMKAGSFAELIRASGKAGLPPPSN